MYKMVTTPNPILVQKAKPVKKFDKKLAEIIHGMEETLKKTYDPVGVGLAAPQVGLPLQIFQMRPEPTDPVITYINPKIEKTSGELDVLTKMNSVAVEKRKPKKGKLLEGCLSIPTIWGYVKRNKEVTLTWQDPAGAHHKKTFKGFNAVIVQHEYDHLQGILFTKHVIEQKNQMYRSSKDANGEDVFEEINLS